MEKAARPTLYFPAELWQKFRIACLRRKLSASAALRALIIRQLDEWAKEDNAQKSSDNA